MNTKLRIESIAEIAELIIERNNILKEKAGGTRDHLVPKYGAMLEPRAAFIFEPRPSFAEECKLKEIKLENRY